jgi:hypothetical protein
MNSNHISSLNKDKSRKNIEHKINIIKQWCSEGIPSKLDESGNQIRDSQGEVVFEWVPTSVLDFSKWDGSQNTIQCREMIGSFKTVSRETLNKEYNSDLKTLLQQSLKLVKVKLLQQTEQSNKLGIIQKINNDLNYWKALAKTMATDIAMLRAQASEQENNLRKLQRAFNNNKEEAKNLLYSKDLEIQSLRQALAKITPLTAIKSGQDD